MTISLDLTDKMVRFPIPYGYQPIKGFPVLHYENIVGDKTQMVKRQALGEGPWDGVEGLWTDAFEIPPEDFVFHPGTADDTPGALFPSDAPHPWTTYIDAKARAGLSESQTDAIFGIYRTLLTPNYNGAGQQLNAAGAVVSPGDPRTEYFFKPNPANVSLDQILRWGKRPTDIINFPAWVDWRDFNDELINWDDAFYTPRSLSLTPTSGGSLTPGNTYYVRVAAIKGADQSSASQWTIETKAHSITLETGQTAFQVNWLIKGDEEDPPLPPGDITEFRVYVGTVDGVWLGYFTVAGGVARTNLVTTVAGVTPGTPLETATAGLLRQIKRFECGLFFLPPYDLASALSRICQISCADWQWSGLGTETYRNDKVRFMSPANRAPVFTLNLAETGMGSFRTYPVDRRVRPNQIIVVFRDRDDKFLGEGQPVILDREQLQEDEGQVKSYTIDGGTMYRSQAQRVASFYARVLCDMDQMAAMTASPRSYHVLPADVVLVTHSTPAWEDVKFMVRRKEETTLGSLGDPIIGQLYTDDLYSDTDHSPIPRPLPLLRLDPFAEPPLVVSVTLEVLYSVQPSKAVTSTIEVTAQFADFQQTQRGRVYLKKSTEGDGLYKDAGTIAPDPETLIGVLLIPGVDAATTYNIRVVTESAFGQTTGLGGAATYTIDVASPVQTVVKIFDNPAPKPSLVGTLGLTIGAAAAAGSGFWFGTVIWWDRGWGYEVFAPSITAGATLGFTDPGQPFLPPTGGTLWLTKEAGSAPVNATPAEIAGGKQNYFVGQEKVGVQTWTSMGANLFKGEDLIRGLDGTDDYQSTHIASEDVMLLDESTFFIPLEGPVIDMTINFKAVTFGLLIAAAVAIPLTILGRSVIEHTPRTFVGNFDDIEGDGLIEWVEGRDFTGDKYDLEIMDAAGTVALRSVVVTPDLNKELSEPISWIITFNDVGANATLLAGGGINTDYADAQFTAESVTEASIVDGLLVEMEVPENGRIMADFVLYPADEMPFTFLYGHGWNCREHYIDFDAGPPFLFAMYMQPDSYSGDLHMPGTVAFPASGPYVPVFRMRAGDRYGILIRPDGIAEYHINYMGPSSKAVWMSSKLVKPGVLYKVAVDQPIAGSFASVGAGVRNPRWVRQGPEWRYPSPAQRFDFSLSDSDPLPATVNARVRQLSAHPQGKPSAWVTGAFVR